MMGNVSRRGHLLPSCLLLVLFLLFSLSPGSCVPLLAKSVDEKRSLDDGAEGRGARTRKAHGLLQDDAAIAPLGTDSREEHAALHAMAPARMSRGAAPQQLLGSQGSAGEDLKLPQSCGGCTWILTTCNPNSLAYNLTMEGAPDCGSGCPTVLDFTGLYNRFGGTVFFIDPRAFKTTGLGHVTQLIFSSLDGGTSGLSSEAFPAGVFNQLTGLTRLDLDGNRMTSVPAAVAQLTGLRILNLRGNYFGNSSLLVGAFDQLTGLHILDLSRVGLSLPPGVFDKLTNLRILDLSGNSISNLPAGIFDKLTGLTGLYLPFLRSSLSAGVFDQLTGLRFLSFDAIELSILPAGVFDKLTGLTGLSLHVSRNNLGKQILPAGAFDQLTNLTVMYLDPPTLFLCFVAIPSSVEFIRDDYDQNDVFNKELYDALPRCEE